MRRTIESHAGMVNKDQGSVLSPPLLQKVEAMVISYSAKVASAWSKKSMTTEIRGRERERERLVVEKPQASSF